MKSYQVILTPETQLDLRRIASAIRTRLFDKLEWIGENAELIQHQALQGDEWKGCYKYRVGDYRIVYKLDHPTQKLIILKIGHRREVYK